MDGSVLEARSCQFIKHCPKPPTYLLIGLHAVKLHQLQHIVRTPPVAAAGKRLGERAINLRWASAGSQGTAAVCCSDLRDERQHQHLLYIRHFSNAH